MDTQDLLKNAEQAVDLLLIKDAQRIKKQLLQIYKRQNNGQPFDKKLVSLQTELEAAIDRVTARHKIPIDIEFPEDLPVSQKRNEIADVIDSNQVLILAGETGSGKTTQIPKICLELGRGRRGLIGHTQPRRIAARTVASRIAEEVKTELGDLIGYQVRFNDHTSDRSLVKLMTDGILLAEIQNDPLLLRYDTLIIDEAHERSLNIDFLLGYLKQLLPKRPDLKLIVTSATIDVDRFAKHFNDAPIIEVSGRTYPVETLYRPWQEEGEDLNEVIVSTVDEILSTRPTGDILIFMSGEREIREASHALKKAQFRHIEVLPLYARLSLAEQNKIFHGTKGRRIVLATNVAETSITVPGIKYVIDPGFARISRYSVRTKVQRLPIEPVSQASANQRKGRCGRVSEGVCYRLYSEEDFLSRPEFTDAEILRTNLASVILQMLQMQIGDIRKFPFVDAPDKRLINDGFKLLEELKAVSSSGKITPLGKSLSQLPVDPRLGAVLAAAERSSCLHDALIIVAALSIQDPRERPADKQQASDEKHRRFWDEDSDFVAYVNLWNYLEEQRQALSQSQLRKLCQKEFINFLRVREWRDLHYQLKLSIQSLGWKEKDIGVSYEQLHRALLCGFLSNIGMRDLESKDKEYIGTRQKRFLIFPGSSQYKKKHSWVVSAEYIETSKLFGHCIAKVDPSWALEVADHLIKRHYFEPHFDIKAGQVKAYMRSTLLGLVLQEKKRVAFTHVDPALANEIFIREALVEGKYRGKGEFFRENKRLINDVHELEAKSRRRDILVDDEMIFRFYRERIPENISNLKGFEYWRKEREKTHPKELFLSASDIMLHEAEGVTREQFPSTLRVGDYHFQLEYIFEPGKQNDGVNIKIPIDVLHDISPETLEWLVPGLLSEKCVNLVKSLPKTLRKHFVPVPQFVSKVLPRLNISKGSLVASLGQALGHLSNIDIPIDAWREDQLDDFYRMNIQLIADANHIVDQGRDLEKLRKKYRSHVKKNIARAGDEWERDEIKEWNFGTLAESVILDRGQVKIKAYPALLKNADSLALKVIDNPAEANYQSRRAIYTLAAYQLTPILKDVRKTLLKGHDLALSMTTLGRKGGVAEHIIEAAIQRCMFLNDKIPREGEAFRAAIDSGRAELLPTIEALEESVITTLQGYVAVKRAIKGFKNPLAIAIAAGDIQQHLDSLIYPGFLFDTPDEWLQNFPRYLQASLVRLEKIGQHGHRDKVWSDTLAEFWQLHQGRLKKEGQWSYEGNALWQQFRWHLEELRVSFFAQSLGTKTSVSEKRLKKLWEESE